FWAITEVPNNFNPRFDALYKIYKYFAPYEGENIETINKAINMLKGEHDFKKLSKPDKNRNTICNLMDIHVKVVDDHIVYEFKGKSFLWKMVRKIVTLLKKIGNHEEKLDIINKIFETTSAFNIQLKPAQPEGLILFDIAYPFSFAKDEYCVNSIRKYVSSKELFYRVKKELNRDILSFLV
ncbi:MAG: hypothetical protein ACTSYR_05090, partial [Candidatus Odinarchaeia archaeon]